MIMTVEQVSRICNRLNICFTVGATERLIERKLKKVPRPRNYYNTSYVYLVDLSSLEQYLIKDYQLDSNTAKAVIYGGKFK